MENFLLMFLFVGWIFHRDFRVSPKNFELRNSFHYRHHQNYFFSDSDSVKHKRKGKSRKRNQKAAKNWFFTVSSSAAPSSFLKYLQRSAFHHLRIVFDETSQKNSIIFIITNRIFVLSSSLNWYFWYCVIREKNCPNPKVKVNFYSIVVAYVKNKLATLEYRFTC